MDRKTDYMRGGVPHSLKIDGRRLFSQTQAADHLGLTTRNIRLLTRSHELTPARDSRDRAVAYTLDDLDRYNNQLSRDKREREVARRLQNGENPVDIYLALPGTSLGFVIGVMKQWAVAAGCWVIEAPRGSYTRWLARLGLYELTPRQIRRVLEALLVDEHTARVARLALDAQRSARNLPVARE